MARKLTWPQEKALIRACFSATKKQRLRRKVLLRLAQRGLPHRPEIVYFLSIGTVPSSLSPLYGIIMARQESNDVILSRLLSRLSKDARFCVISGKNDNRYDQYLHVHVVHFASCDVFEYASDSWDDERLRKFTSWVESKTGPLMTIDDYTEEFAALMRREMQANSAKDKRGPWIKVPPRELLSDILYHAGKLAVAIKENNANGVEEFAADVGNLAMMTLYAFKHQPQSSRWESDSQRGDDDQLNCGDSP